MGNHIAETRSAAGMSKTTLCYTGVSKERENEKILMDCILKCIIPGQNIIVKIENIKSIW